MKSRFAQQRATNAEYQVSEEEERVILNELQRISESHTSNPDETDNLLPSFSSTPLNYLSWTQTSPNKGSKYYGNSLFSSSQSSDASYLRKVSRTGSDRSMLSRTSADSSLKVNDLIPSYPFSKLTEEFAQEPPLGTNTTGYISDKTPTTGQLNLQPSTSPPPIHGRHERKSSRADLARISMALSNVMKEIEEEGILESDSGLANLLYQDKRTSVSGQAHTVSCIDISADLQPFISSL
jgi:serine/arginine repetitive matrix protein 2